MKMPFTMLHVFQNISRNINRLPAVEISHVTQQTFYWMKSGSTSVMFEDL